MTLAPLPRSRFDRAGRSLTVSILAWGGIIAGILGCVSVALLFLSPRPMPLNLTLGAPIGLAVAIGLRMRLEWARRGYIAAMAFGALSFAVRALREVQTSPSILVALLVSLAFYGLIIAKLCSRGVREEFDAASEASA
jgi:hypothetical protein